MSYNTPASHCQVSQAVPARYGSFNGNTLPLYIVVNHVEPSTMVFYKTPIIISARVFLSGLGENEMVQLNCKTWLFIEFLHTKLQYLIKFSFIFG